MALLSETERPSTVTLLDSLLDAIVRLDGEALIMHVGEKPYVVLSSTSTNAFRGPLSWGQVELSSRPLSGDAVLSMLGQMLSPVQRRLLDDIGAVEHEIEAPGGLDERFVVTAARGGDDVWVEVRRRPRPVEGPALPEPMPAAETVAARAGDHRHLRRPAFRQGGRISPLPMRPWHRRRRHPLLRSSAAATRSPFASPTGTTCTSP